ncbi:hypothetical protein [Marinobacter pelagius]|uniref:hypothetical protein n=1 Tax=Marinobacter pelagius TaxID=379482 RepID=UPI001C690A17|nr:hypothetical protein [Marinobacter pelagius]
MEPVGNAFTMVLPLIRQHTFGESTGMACTAQKIKADILAPAECWAGSQAAALAWYHCERIPSLGNRTPEALVAWGRGDEVRAYLAHLADGGYA